jgi:drug/metabolite transporter (DMT)-like permease
MQGQAITTTNARKNLVMMVLAFAAVYIIWGSTYLGIKYAIETIPTFILGGLRFTVAGIILLAIGRLSPGYEKPKAVHWRTAMIVGLLLLVGGNGGVVMAEHYISSGMTALLVATVPFFVVLLNWIVLRQSRPSLKVAAGLLIGFLGVWLLLPGSGPGVDATEASNQLFGTVLLIGAALSWALGTLYGGRGETIKSLPMGAGMQMFSGGVMMLVIAVITGEFNNFNIEQVSAVSLFALAYLVVFGAIVAYTAYSWLMQNAKPAQVSTYAYVNPAIAVFLGWMIAGETLTGQMLVGAAIIVGSVALITSQKKSTPDEASAIDRSEMPDYKPSAARA